MTSANTVSKRYATALVDLAEEKKAVAKVEKDMNALGGLLLGSADFAAFVASPTTSETKQLAALSDFSKKLKLQTITANFLGVITQNGRLSALPSLIDAVLDDISKRRGEMVVQVESANALTATQQKALKKELDSATGKSVLLDASINPDLLGGMIVTVGSTRIDSSVSGRLERLQSALNRRVYNDINDNSDTQEKKEA